MYVVPPSGGSAPEGPANAAGTSCPFILLASPAFPYLCAALSLQPPLLIKDLPDQERPRERLANLGAEALRNAELIAILLRTGMKGVSAISVAEQLLQRYPSLDELARAPLADLSKTKGIGRDKAIALKSAFTLAQRMAREIRAEAPLVETPEQVANLLREEYRQSTVESFKVILLNRRNRLIRIESICQGTVDSLLIHPREVFRLAISANATTIVLAHNHPSGDPTPSSADLSATGDIVRAGQILKIDVLDHVIIGMRTSGRAKDYFSIRQSGLVAF
jgi:DNA repair protein RadC